jgi:1A family penicillin-binding protein
VTLSLRHPRTIKDFAVLALAIVVTVIALIAGAVVVRYGFAVNKLARGIGQTMFYGADGKPWFPLEEHRRDVPINRISAYLRDAVVAVEDHRFHSHLGVDPIAVGRAVWRDVRAGGLEEGGSTLTQQLARTLFLTASRGDWMRKGKEAVLAVMIEQRLSKQQILELYLNRIYLGGNVYGVEAMSQNVFGKSASQVTLSEAAFIAGLIQQPSRLWPWSHYDRAVQRSHVVLARMRAEGFITAQAEQQARATPPRVLADPGLNRGAAGYAQDYLRQQFKAVFEDDNPPDWKVQTTFVPALQREAERAVTQGLAKFRQSGLQAALVVIDPQTGDVLALVGGRDYRRTAFNRATAAKRQPGSAFKPFLFAAALESGMSPISPISDLTDRVPGHDEWEVTNASLDTRDTLTLREALFESNNQAAVKLQTSIGSRAVLRMAQSVGLPRMPDVPSLALGVGEATPLQLTAAYAVFPNGGFAVTPRPLVQVLDNDGYAVLNRPVERRPVISEAIAYQMVSMLSDVVNVGTGASARSLGVRFPAAGKTGTTNDFKDAWFVGFSSTLVAGVWVGFDKPATIGADAYGARYALPIWADFMSKAARIRKPGDFRVPTSVDAARLCRVSHMLPRETCPTIYTEYFKHGDVIPDDECDVHRGPNAAEVIGSIFSKLGKGIGKIFGR